METPQAAPDQALKPHIGYHISPQATAISEAMSDVQSAFVSDALHSGARSAPDCSAVMSPATVPMSGGWRSVRWGAVRPAAWY